MILLQIKKEKSYGVNIISANIIINFAICNREKGKDFRRALFAKEKEIFSLFGQDFQKRNGGSTGQLLEVL